MPAGASRTDLRSATDSIDQLAPRTPARPPAPPPGRSRSDNCRAAYAITDPAGPQLRDQLAAAASPQGLTARGGSLGHAASLARRPAGLQAPGPGQHQRQRPGRARPGNPARRGGRGPQRHAQRRARPGRAGADRRVGGAPSRPPLARASRGATSLNPSFGLFTDASALWPVTSRSPCGEQPLSVRVGASDGIRGHLAVVTPAAPQASSSRSPGSLEHGSSNAPAPGLCSRAHGADGRLRGRTWLRDDGAFAPSWATR